MKTLILLNDVRELVARMSTTLLICAAARRHDVSLCGVDDFGVSDGVPIVRTHRVTGTGDAISPSRVAAAARRQGAVVAPLREFDLVLVRTNPGRDGTRHASHAAAMYFLREAQRAGMCVVNTPYGLQRAATKMYLASLPSDVVPDLMVSRHAKSIEKWAQDLGASIVLKPITGTRGNDVFVAHREDTSNLRQMIQVVTRDGYAMAQRFLPEAAAGDTRVIVVGGRILEIDGHAAAVSRVPARGDFRSNVHAGGKPALGVVTSGMRAVVRKIGKQLVRDGLFLVGVDFIADKILEINVFSPGGFGNAMEHTQLDFPNGVIEALEQLVVDRGRLGIAERDRPAKRLIERDETATSL
jgi:glutathione synthase